jgi:hypothetical protein
VQRPGLIGCLLLAISVILLIVVPLDSAWKWPTVILLLIAGFVMLFISAAQLPSSRRVGGDRTDSGADGIFYSSGGHSGGNKHSPHSDTGIDAHDGGGGDGGGGGGGD